MQLKIQITFHIGLFPEKNPTLFCVDKFPHYYPAFSDGRRNFIIPNRL